MGNKRGVVWNEIVWWIVGIVLLAIIIIAIVYFKNSGINLGDKLKELLRFGR